MRIRHFKIVGAVGAVGAVTVKVEIASDDLGALYAAIRLGSRTALLPAADLLCRPRELAAKLAAEGLLVPGKVVLDAIQVAYGKVASAPQHSRYRRWPALGVSDSISTGRNQWE